MTKFAHTNIITDNWKKLADIYIKVFDCKPLYPERDLSGNWLDKATSISNAHFTGIHLALPGYEENPPTFEIFQKLSGTVSFGWLLFVSVGLCNKTYIRFG